jgi:cobalt-zinc-cadmium efflux system outer membrane protein
VSSRLLLAALLAGLAGCTSYSPAPLDRDYLSAELAPRPMNGLRADSLALSHPLLPPLVYDPSDGLSPDEAAVYAVLANPELRAARAARGVGQANLLAAGLLPDPQLALSADLPVHDDTGALTATGLGLSLDLNAFFTRGAEKASARAALAQVDLDIAWQEWQVAQQARLEVYRGAFLERQLALAQEAETALADGQEILERATALRLTTRIEQGAAADALSSARSTRLDLERQLAASHLELNRVLGLPPETALELQVVELPFAGATDSTLVLPAASCDSLLAEVQARRLDLLALRRGYESQEEALRVAVLRRFPRINIGVNRLRNDAGLLTLGPAVSIDLPFLDGGRGEQATARATRAELRQEYAARVFAARAEIADLEDALLRTREQLAAEEAALPVQRALVAAYDAARQAGDADVITDYEVRSALVDRELGVLQLRRDLAELAVALETTSGGLITAKQTEVAP